MSTTLPTVHHAGEEIDNRWILRHRLGEGANGEVWCAFDKQLQSSGERTTGKEVALKFFRNCSNEDDRGIVRREVGRTRGLNHPHIVRFYDLHFSSQMFVSMEYLAGGSLEDYIRRHSYNERGAIRVITDIASAIDFAHRQEIIHFDIKPSNILLELSGSARDPEVTTAKLADFGLAMRHSTVADHGRLRPRGTPGYIAPELLANGELTNQS